MAHKQSARWDGNDLMVVWYGAKEEDYAATWELRKGKDGRNGTLIFDAVCETMTARYYEKPSAEEALARILNWQAYC